MQTVETLRADIIAKINLTDEKLLQIINHFMVDYDEEITPEQKAELDRRLERIKKGETKFYSWDEAQKILDFK